MVFFNRIIFFLKPNNYFTKSIRVGRTTGTPIKELYGEEKAVKTMKFVGLMFMIIVCDFILRGIFTY